MSTLRRVIAVVRLRRLFAAVLFLFCTYLFANNLDPTPQYVVHTRTEADRKRLTERGFEWTTVRAVSLDGSQVITADRHSGFRFNRIRQIDLWNSVTRRNETPVHWYWPEWRNYLEYHTGRLWDDTPLADLASNPTGQEYLRDHAAWAALGERLGINWEVDKGDWRRTRDDLRFSSDGRHIAYVIPTGWPATTPWPKELSKATVIEDARTGRRAATLLAVTAKVTIGPGGRTAVWSLSKSPDLPDVIYVRWGSDEVIVEQPQFMLWDIETSTPRAQLWHRDDSFACAEYTPDGRYVFVSSSSAIRWWDASTGQQVGETVFARTRKFMDGGRVLVIQSTNHDVLYFWDVTTGRPLPDWELPEPREGTRKIGEMEATGGDRYVALHVDPDPQNPGNSIRAMDWLVKRLSNQLDWSDRSQIKVLDVIERREIGKVRRRVCSVLGEWSLARYHRRGRSRPGVENAVRSTVGSQCGLLRRCYRRRLDGVNAARPLTTAVAKSRDNLAAGPQFKW